jgi:SAM-dependent methyltransferase
MATIQLFERASHARVYSKYRPTYSKAILKIISGYLSRNGCSRDLAVDVGCGSGQSTFQLAEYFTQVIGVDISKAQIHEAQGTGEQEGHKNLKFVVGNGMDLPVETSSVDVVTIAQAWHWLPDTTQFYSECKRVLKPGGCISVYGYGNVKLLDGSCHLLVENFYRNTLQGCWHKERRHIDNEYADVNLPFANTERHDIEMTKNFSLNDFIGYLSSWSGYERYLQLNPENAELQALKDKLEKLLLGSGGSDCSEVVVETKFPVFMMLGQKA